MVQKSKSKHKSNKTIKKNRAKRSRTWKVIAIALYITFLILSTIAFTADRNIEPYMKDSYEYHLRYPKDGRQTHYYVERINTSRIGKIDLVYTTASNTLDVEVDNIKVLHIYCRSMYEDECREVYGIDPSDNSNYYKWYFIEKNHFNVNIDSDEEIEELKFIDTPLAYKVIVNGVKWEKDIDYFYEIDPSGMALSHVPSGHTIVDLYFKPVAGTPPVAVLNASRMVVQVDHSVMFDGSGSYDPDGYIQSFIFDFGEGTFRGGAKHSYSYSKPGIYGVILTVFDNEDLVDHTFVNITVVETTDIPEIQGIVPNQEKPEDSPPWSLNLSIYEPIPSTSGIEFYWYLTGENISLYTVAGENSTDDRLIFTPVADAFGNNLVTIWLKSTENLTASQSLWVNITPVNDPPSISDVPDLILHYDDPYSFNYEPYVFDKETPKHDLTLNVFDGYEGKYISIQGLNATYYYPKELIGETIYATVSVSDGAAFAQDVINIQITSDYIPKLVKNLPDVWLFEGTKKKNVFDLDDYFTDPDNDAIYFSYGQTHLEININRNHTVDISAASEWTGNELVTFRARDPIGALAEDSIIVTVLPVNDPPTISGVPNFHIHYDHDYKFDLTPYIHDNDNTTAELRIIPSDPEHIRLDILNNMVIILNYPGEYLDQSVIVRLTVFDGLDSGFQDVTVTITEDFPPELLSPLPDIVFLEDIPLNNAFDLDFYFLDVDGDVLYYTSGNEFINITINTDHTVDFSSPQDWFGTEVVYFRATDPTGALQQDLVTVTVLPVNDPPNILKIPPQYGNESERWVLDLEPYILDVDNNISELDISLSNDFVVVSGSTLIFLGSPELPNELEVIVSDGEYAVTETIEIHLNLAKGPKILTLWDFLMNILPFLLIIILIIALIAGFVYRKKSQFTAEEVFLIHKGGTLITHLTRNMMANVDDIIFSGMFTAVQEFIRDTFVSDYGEGASDGLESKWALDELKLGDNNILIERSENTYLAVIFSGEGSKRLRRIVNRLLEKIETKYEKILPTWDGNVRELEGTREILSVLIELPPKPDDEPDKSHVEEKIQGSELKVSPAIKSIDFPSIYEPPMGMGSVRSQPLVIAKSVPRIKLEPKLKPKSKELLEYSADQTGANLPGLPAWRLKKKKARTKFSSASGYDVRYRTQDIRKLPMALNIKPVNHRQRAIVIEKCQPLIKTRHDIQGSKIEQPIPLNPPNKFDKYKSSKPIKIQISSGGKEYTIDPSRSLLKQLAEIDDLENP